MTTCPLIVTSSDDKIQLSSYSRTVGTYVVIGCRGFGRHVKDPTNVLCGANSQWSEQPNLECDMKLDDKETVYVAVAVVCTLLFVFGMCWISIAIFCRRHRGRGWGSRWTHTRRRAYGWFGFDGGKRSRDRIDKSNDRYDGDHRLSSERNDDKYPFEQSDKFRDESDRNWRNEKSRDGSDKGWLVSRNDRFQEESDRGWRNDKSRDGSDKGWLVGRKSDRYGDSGSLTDKKQPERGSWADDRDRFRHNIYFMGVDSREWDRTRPPLYPGESWRYGQYGDGKSRAAGGWGDMRTRDSYNRSNMLDQDRNRGQFLGHGQGRYGRNDGYNNWDNLGNIPQGDMRTRDSYNRSNMLDQDRNRGQFLGHGQGRYGRNDGYNNWDNLGNIPQNDMESIYRLRRKYDRVFDEYHPEIPNNYLPRDPKAAQGKAIGPSWLSNYPVLKLTDHETIYSQYGDPMMRPRRYSDTFVDRQGYRSQRLEGGGGDGGGFYRSIGEGGGGLYRSSSGNGGGFYRSGGEGGGYRRTRRYSDSRLDTGRVRRIEYVQNYAPRKTYDAEERRAYDDVVMSSPGYEVITLPANYTTVENGPKLVQLGTEQLQIPTYRRSYVKSKRNANTDYFLSRNDAQNETRKSQRPTDHTLYHGFGQRTEVYEDGSDLGRRSYVVPT